MKLRNGLDYDEVSNLRKAVIVGLSKFLYNCVPILRTKETTKIAKIQIQQFFGWFETSLSLNSNKNISNISKSTLECNNFK